MYPGQYTLCLQTQNTEEMLTFYAALGMTTHTFTHNSAMAWNGDIHLALMSFLREHSINFRGADPSEIHRNAVAAGLIFEQEPQRYRKEEFDADADGNNWLIHDPDGNNVFFDTNDTETGAEGLTWLTQRVVLATRRQLKNVNAPEVCRDAFQTTVVDQYAPTDSLRPIGHHMTDQGERFPGFFNYCIKTTDNETSAAWYRAVGLDVGDPSAGHHVHVGTSDCRIALMTFLPENWLNFRGGDVFQIFEWLSETGLPLEGEPARYTAEEFGTPGAHWQTRDPDGNQVYFDTTDEELIEPGDKAIVRRVLEAALEQLQDIGAHPDCKSAVQHILSTHT